MIRKNKNVAVWNWLIVRRAIVDSFSKLNPRSMMTNPVMFVVEVGSVLTTLQLIRELVAPIPGVTNTKFELQITRWLWFTVLFANFAEAMAEGRGKAQADNLRLAPSLGHRLCEVGKQNCEPQPPCDLQLKLSIGYARNWRD